MEITSKNAKRGQMYIYLWAQNKENRKCTHNCEYKSKCKDNDMYNCEHKIRTNEVVWAQIYTHLWAQNKKNKKTFKKVLTLVSTSFIIINVPSDKAWTKTKHIEN